MNGLRLRAVAAHAPSSAATWAIECPSPGVVLINVEIEGSNSLAPLHWRTGDWTKPPLDIEVNPSDGAVQAIQVVLQDENVPLGALRAGHEGAVGIPLVDVEGWPDDRYRDVRCSVELARATTGELIVTFGELGSTSHAGLPGSLVFGWDGSGHLCEIVIGPLTPEDWDDIDAFTGDIGGV